MPDGHAADIGVGWQEGLQRDGRRDLAHPDQARGGLEDGLVQRLEVMLRLQEVGDAVKCVVVDQDRAQKALFRFDIMRRAPIGGSSGFRREFENVRISQGHGRAIAIFWGGCGAGIKRRLSAKRKQKLAAINRSLKWWMIGRRGTRRA
ncbi:hypothetical protein ACVW1A_006136 [Bradyrhizobium sp. LB1.3]